MTAPRPAQTAREPGAPAPDPTIALQEIQTVIVGLAASDNPVRQLIAAYLREATDLIGYVARVKAERGASFDLQVRTARRNDLLRQLGQTTSVIELHKSLTHYAGTSWSRDSSKTNPYAEHDDRCLMYEILQLKSRVPTQSHLRAILKRK